MMLTNYMSINEYKHTDLRYDISPIPFMEDPKTLTVMIGMAVNKYSKEKEAAKLFVQHLSSEKVQLLITQQTLSIPSNKSIAESVISEDTLNRPSFRSLPREPRNDEKTSGFEFIHPWLSNRP